MYILDYNDNKLKNCPMKETDETQVDITQKLVILLWKNGLIKRLNLNHHHSHLQIQLDSEQIDSNVIIKDSIIDGLIILCKQKSIEFDFILAKESWIKDLAQRIGKPFIEFNSLNEGKYLTGKNILMVTNEFYIPKISHEFDKISSLGGKVTDVISIFFDKNDHCPSILNDLEKTFKIHPFLTKQKIEEFEKN